jgi:hypothetical protein
MIISEVRRLSPVDRLIYWIQERETIRLVREAGQSPPWTDDVILQTYRFTNVRRMDDRVSRWLLDNWYKPNWGHQNMVLAICMARFLNLPDSLAAVGFPFSYRVEYIKEVLRERAREGVKNFNGAYMVRGNDGEDKIASVFDHYIAPLAASKTRLQVEQDSMQVTWSHLTPYYGFGSFMAGQVVADLRWAWPGKWRDRNDWAPMGPGSKRGMNRLQGRPADAPLGQEKFLRELREMMELCRDRLSASITDRLEAIDYQNCLCEYDKHSRVLFGEGRPKQLYRSKPWA